MNLDFYKQHSDISLTTLLRYITAAENINQGIPEEYREMFSAELLKWAPGYVLTKLAANPLLPNVIIHKDLIHIPIFLTPRGKILAAADSGRHQSLVKVSFRQPRKITGLNNYVLIGTKEEIGYA